MIPRLTGLFLTLGIAAAQMPPRLPNRDSYAIRNVDPKAPCRFAREYVRIKGIKTDPRVAYMEAEAILHKGESLLGSDGLCRVLSEQTEDGVVVFDKARGFLQIFSGDSAINEAMAYFAGTNGAPGVFLYVRRDMTDWSTAVIAHRDGKWLDVTAEYLNPLKLDPKKDYIVVPQYGRTIRVLREGDEKFVHRQWLTWDGRKFTPLGAKTAAAAGWKCPDSYRYFEPEERGQYCR